MTIMAAKNTAVFATRPSVAEIVLTATALVGPEGVVAMRIAMATMAAIAAFIPVRAVDTATLETASTSAAVGTGRVCAAGKTITRYTHIALIDIDTVHGGAATFISDSAPTEEATAPVVATAENTLLNHGRTVMCP